MASFQVWFRLAPLSAVNGSAATRIVAFEAERRVSQFRAIRSAGFLLDHGVPAGRINRDSLH
jgi:hypothetical protein